MITKLEWRKLTRLILILINKFLTKNKVFITQAIVLLGFFCISFLINRIPSNSFVAGGDFYQLISPQQNLDRYFYAWINQVGQGMFSTILSTFPFYSLVALLSYLGLSSNTIAGFYVFFILYFSYIGFYLSIKFLYQDLSERIRVGSALVYALNNFTLTIFTYPWGFSHHFLIYIFIPPLVLIFLKILIEENKWFKYFIYFSIIFLASTIAYNNPSFLILLFFVQFLLIVLLLIFRKIRVNKMLFTKLFAITFVYILLSFWITVPSFVQANNTIQRLYSNKVMGDDYLANWVSSTSSNFLNSFLLALDKNRIPVSKIGFSTLVSFVYFGVILSLATLGAKRRRLKEKNYISFILLLVFLFLSVRAYGPFKEIGLFIYQLPIFVVFRSPEKIFSVIPFVYAVLLAGLLYVSRLRSKIIYLIFGVLLIIPYYFYIGQVYGMLSDGSSSNYKYIVKVPQEYYDIQDIINGEQRMTSIISLPYSVKNSINWAQYPKWGFIGHDVLHLLYNKFYISANSYDHPLLETELSFKGFNEGKEDPENFLRLVKKFSGQFIIYHKDIDPEWIENSKHLKLTIDALEQESKIRLIESNDYFDFYRVQEYYIEPLISSSGFVYFKNINPTKYHINISAKEKNELRFNQSYDSRWNLYLEKYSNNSWCQEVGHYKNAIECEHTRKFFEGEELKYLWKKSLSGDSHKIIDDYANSWTIDSEYIKSNYSSQYYKENLDGSIDIKLTMYYKPQSYFYLGLIVSIIFLLVCGAYYIWSGLIKKYNLAKQVANNN